MSNDQITDPNGETTEHFGPPTFGGLTANWTTPVSNAAGDDLAGQVGATSGGTPPAAGNVGVVTFAGQFARAPRSVVVDGLLGAVATAVTPAGFTITTASAPAASTAFTWYYHVDP